MYRFFLVIACCINQEAEKEGYS